MAGKEVVEAPRQRGRKTLLTPVLQQEVLKAMEHGLPYTRACQLWGVDEKTALQWLARGEGRHSRPSTPQLVEFVEAVRAKEIHVEQHKLELLERAAHGGQVIYEKVTEFPDGRVLREVRTQPPQWLAAAWYLERRWPDRWGKRERQDLRVLMHEVVKRIAAESGVGVDEVMAEAERLIAEA